MLLSNSIHQSIVLDGTGLAKEKSKYQLLRAKEYATLYGREPSLAVILVGEDSASQIYVNTKIQKCRSLEIDSQLYKLPATTSQQELDDLIKSLNQDDSIDSILLQVPLPKGLNTNALIESINPLKDVDGFTSTNLGYLTMGNENGHPICCTPAGIIELLDHYGYSYEGKNAVVVGSSNTVGKPAGIMLLNREATLQICNSKTKDLENKVKSADLLIVAVGYPNLIKASWIKPGTWIVDVGINRMDDGKLVGDCEREAYNQASHYSPVPGGVGPMTVSKLIDNCLDLAFSRAKLKL